MKDTEKIMMKAVVAMLRGNFEEAMKQRKLFEKLRGQSLNEYWMMDGTYINFDNLTVKRGSN